jgi:hypothetical protein
MGSIVLICPCGQRLSGSGMVPGKRGRCPDCGRALRVPRGKEAPSPSELSDDDVCDILAEEPEIAQVQPAQAPADDEDEWNWRGSYDLAPPAPSGPSSDPLNPSAADEPSPVEPDSPIAPAAQSSDDDEWAWHGTYDLGASPPAPIQRSVPDHLPVAVDDGSPAPPAPWGRDVIDDSDDDEPSPTDPWWPPRLLYPSRGAEGMMMVVALGFAAWVMGTLIPEYCLAILGDGERLGTPTMGSLIALISATPSLILSPLILLYGIQYLARVLVTSAEGETLPPRPPDRNTEGLLDGLGSWLRWIILGAGVGLLPLASYHMILALSGWPWSPSVSALLGVVGIPYALMALMLTFLHDDDLAARPSMVFDTITRLGLSFLGLSLTVIGLLALVGVAFACVLALRGRAFWFYILLSLICWLLAAWLPIVAMHTLGAYYAPRRCRLKWRRKRLRWGAN